MAIWQELARVEDDLAWSLFLLVRRVRDIADAPPTGVMRWVWGGDVRAVAPAIPELSADFLLLSDERLALSEATAVGAARSCQRIADWAAERGLSELAIRFAEAGVAMRPGSARRNFTAGRTHRLVGRSADAEILYERAICLSRPKADWRVYVRGHLGLGNIHMTHGTLDRATAHFVTAASAAQKRSGERWIAALTAHDLFSLHAEAGMLDEAVHHARRAAEWFPAHHPQLPWLAHDFCFVLIELRLSVLAASLLEAVVSTPVTGYQRVLAWSTLARAAGGSRDLARYRDAVSEVDRLSEFAHHHAAAIHANMGIGAHQLGLLDEARRHAESSLRWATVRNDATVLAVASELQESVVRLEPPRDLRGGQLTASVRLLADLLRDRLANWRRKDWRRKDQRNRDEIWILRDDG